MKRMFLIFVLALFSFAAQASQTYVVIADSIGSSVAQGKAHQLFLHLVAAERDIVFKSLASPGASMAATDFTGFNQAMMPQVLDTIGGYFGAYNGIILQTGTNDFARSSDINAYSSSLARILAHAKLKNKKVLMLDLIWRRDEEVPNAVGLQLIHYRYVRAVQCANYPGVCHFVHRDTGKLNSSAAAAWYDVNERAAGKELHPNVQGHRYLADWVKAGGAAVGIF